MAVRIAVLTMPLLVFTACTTTSEIESSLTMAEIETGIARLSRPLPGDISALYHLRVPSTGGLRLSIVTRGTGGRLTVAEQFGSALSITAWTDSLGAVLFDLKEGCKIDITRVASPFGIGDIPMPHVARLFGGALPARDSDLVTARPDGSVEISGDDWAVVAALETDPWRVVEIVGSGSSPWRVTLANHTVSVPGRLRIEHEDGQWAELELKRLQWDAVASLPALPDLPSCEVR